MPAPTTQSELCVTTLLTSGSPAPLSCSLLKASPPQGAPISVATPPPYCTNQNPGGGFLDSFLSFNLFLACLPAPTLPQEILSSHTPLPANIMLVHAIITWTGTGLAGPTLTGSLPTLSSDCSQ